MLLKKKEKMTMSKIFGELRAGDEVYVIIGSNVEIVKVKSAEPSPRERGYTFLEFENNVYSLPSDWKSLYDDVEGDIYCDIDEAIKAMKEICEKALHNYREASDALNKLELKKKMI